MPVTRNLFLRLPLLNLFGNKTKPAEEVGSSTAQTNQSWKKYFPDMKVFASGIKTITAGIVSAGSAIGRFSWSIYSALVSPSTNRQKLNPDLYDSFKLPNPGDDQRDFTYQEVNQSDPVDCKNTFQEYVRRFFNSTFSLTPSSPHPSESDPSESDPFLPGGSPE